MYFEQIYLGCLAQASYFIGDGDTAVVVDPRRDIDEYVEKARVLGMSIRHVIATHVHADFVAGLAELADRTGATIHMGSRFEGDLACETLAEDDEITFGNVTIRTLETPGHTPESICLLVEDSTSDEPPRLLTGDTLFIGDVGRPDLVGSRGFSPQDMAAMMYDSLRENILPLDDATEVYPGHGPGSACGRQIGNETSSTIGAQRATNWALAERPKPEFIELLTTRLPPPPRYFQHAAAMNRSGPTLAGDLPPLRELTAHEFDIGMENGSVALDVRSAAEHGASHLPGSLNIGLGGSFASWTGSLIDPESTIVVIAETPEQASEAAMRLRRVGLDDVFGFRLASQFSTSHSVPQIDVKQLRRRLDSAADEWQVIDVRREVEFESGHAPGAVSAPLDRLPAAPSIIDGLDPERATAVICASGYRSSAALHFLTQRGFARLYNVAGGTNAWLAAAYPVEKPELS